MKWVALTVLVPVPWGGRAWAPPIRAALSWPEGNDLRRRHQSSIDWARQLALQIRRRAPEDPLVLVLGGMRAEVQDQ